MDRLTTSVIATGAIVFFISFFTPKIVSSVLKSHSFPGWPQIDAIVECSNLDDYFKHSLSIKKHAPWITNVFILANPTTTKTILDINKNALVFNNSYEIIHNQTPSISEYFLYFRTHSELTENINQKDYLYFVDVKIPYGMIQYIEKDSHNGKKDNTITELFEEIPDVSIITKKPQIHFKENYKILYEKMVSDKIKPETIELYTYLTTDTVKKT